MIQKISKMSQKKQKNQVRSTTTDFLYLTKVLKTLHEQFQLQVLETMISDRFQMIFEDIYYSGAAGRGQSTKILCHDGRR